MNAYYLTCTQDQRVKFVSLMAENTEQAFFLQALTFIQLEYGYSEEDLNYVFNNGIVTIFTPDKKFKATII